MQYILDMLSGAVWLAPLDNLHRRHSPHRWRRGERAGHQHRRDLVTGGDAASAPGSSWPRPREPLPLETSWPGVFAAGDARYASVKRCAAAIGEGSMAAALVHRRLAEAGGD
jgi:thioredoxin reductase (NADPH)